MLERELKSARRELKGAQRQLKHAQRELKDAQREPMTWPLHPARGGERRPRVTLIHDRGRPNGDESGVKEEGRAGQAQGQ